MKIILQKYLADAGVCSRREGEELIKQGRVTVNGRKAEPGMRVDENDEIRINGKKIGLAKVKIYIKLNKPKGFTCTNRKFEGEKNVFDLVPLEEKLIIAGRLDKNSRGLVLLTNDGELAQRLTHPKFEHEKEYEVKIAKLGMDIGKEDIRKFKTGIDIGEDGGIVKAKDVINIGKDKFKVILTEGKKRQIRKMFEALNCEVVDLVRVRIETLRLSDLREGEWRYLDESEIKNLKSKI